MVHPFCLPSFIFNRNKNEKGKVNDPFKPQQAIISRLSKHLVVLTSKYYLLREFGCHSISLWTRGHCEWYMGELGLVFVKHTRTVHTAQRLQSERDGLWWWLWWACFVYSWIMYYLILNLSRKKVPNKWIVEATTPESRWRKCRLQSGIFLVANL